MPSGGVRLSGGPVLSDAEAPFQESDASSIITISERFAASDTEEENGLHDKQKYRLPDPGKTRLHLRTKEPLSPDPRPVPPSPPRTLPNGSLPSTPTMRSAAQWQRPPRQSPHRFSNGGANASSESPHRLSMVESPHRLSMGESTHRLSMGGANGSSENVSDSDFVSSGLSRAGSIYTLGRVSLQGQLSHLTSLRLPDANSLAKRISDIPASTDAAKALSDASDQIRMWIARATDVLNGLNAEDDVEWAAAAGRDGIDDVDAAITRFQRLVDVYLLSIEELQTREDISALPAEDLKATVQQMEDILSSWQRIRETLRGVKGQVEVALEWEELWNTVLGELGQEMDGMNRLVFEMEEKRHEGTGSLLSSRDSIDLHELETIVEERPGKGAPLSNHRLSLPPFAPLSTPPTNENREDSSLLALFARMQPLRASLDFLPMRLATFQIRGRPVFPSACEDLDQRKTHLEEQWVRLEADADSLRRELGEDRWVLVFRNAGQQALKMEESITRSFNKLKEAVDTSEQQVDAPSFAKKLENYEAKKTHYGPAIERVLAIIDRGVHDRLTVNGEILRLQSDMKERWNALQLEMQDMDSKIEDICSESKDTQLRDSVSTVMSSERSIASSLVDTPVSSPASSVMAISRKSSFQGSRTPTPLHNPKARNRSSSRVGPSSIPRRIPLTESGEFTSSPYSSPLAARSSSNISVSTTRTDLPASNRPRWHQAAKIESRDFRPLSAFEPSPYAKTPVPKHTDFLRSTSSQAPRPISAYVPGGRIRNVTTPNPSRTQPRAPSTVPRVSIAGDSTRKSSLPVPISTPSPLRPTGARATSAMATRPPPSTLRTPTLAVPKVRRGSLLSQPVLPSDGNEADNESPTHHRSRPPSALASGRRSTMLPTRNKTGVQEEKPKWR